MTIRFRAVGERRTGSRAMLGTASRRVTSDWNEKWLIIPRQIIVVRCLRVWNFLVRTGSRLFKNKANLIGKISELIQKLRAVFWLHQLPSSGQSTTQTRNNTPKILHLLLNHSKLSKYSLKELLQFAMIEVMTSYNLNKTLESSTTRKYSPITETISRNTK